MGYSRKQNEKETAQANARDQNEREDLIKKQLIQRRPLQMQLNQLQTQHEKDHQNLIRDLSHISNAKDKATPEFSRLKEQSPSHSPVRSRRLQNNKNLDNLNIDLEPEV